MLAATTAAAVASAAVAAAVASADVSADYMNSLEAKLNPPLAHTHTLTL